MKSTRRIGLLLTLVFLLPALFYSVYELSSLDQDEEMIQEIYTKQLEAMLFSVNQYSDDVLGSWTSRVETGIENDTTISRIPAKINDLLLLNEAIYGIFIADTAHQKMSRQFSIQRDRDDALWNTAMQALSDADTLVRQLVKYKKSGFQKISRVPLSSQIDSTIHCLIFITEPQASTFKIVGLLIDAEAFIENVVGPRLQVISRDQFILSVVRKDNNATVYSTLTTNTTEQPTTAEALTKDFWIFPEYSLGIRTSGTTLQQLVRERTKTNFWLLITLDLILILSVILVFRNLKREVDLAQNKADFVSNVSHEIRTPLALISMFAETLEMDRVPTEEKKREYYRIISKEAQRLSGIVNKILNFSQTEAKKKTLHFEKLNLDAEVQGVLSTYDFHLSNKGFEYTLIGHGNVSVYADREALVESVINLIDNAVKYSSDTKRIEIKTGTNNGQGFIAVKDYGVGITKKDQKHIFDKFYRVSSGNLAKSRGTGLGLSLVKQLMEEQKGKVTVESEPGKGSTFTLYFQTA